MPNSCDVAIVGAGAAGCVLAARLSEDCARRVMLIDAGRDTPPGAVPHDILDTFPTSYFNPSYFWPGLHASVNVDAAPVPYQQPRVMGGGSSVMGMWALRGLPGDYDAWRDLGATGWGWQDVLPSFRRLERAIDYAGPEHGREGPMPLRRFAPEAWPGFVRALAQACAARQLPLKDDPNVDFADGVFPVPLANDGAMRVTSASGYLTEAVRRRPNLEVLTGATVARVLLDGRRAVGVEIMRDGGGRERVTAAEVIVSAGGVHAPALLLRSGIGPAEALRALGIAPVLDRRGVGRGLQNHGVVNLTTRLAPEARQPRAMRTYGIASARASSHAAGAPEADLHLQFIAQLGDRPHGNRLGILGAALYAPLSRGSVTLRSADPAAMPAVAFRFLSHPLDRQRMRQVVQLGLDLLGDPVVAPLHGDVFAVVPSSLARRLNSPGWRNRLLSGAVAALLDTPQPLRRQVLRRVGHLVEPGTAGSDGMIDKLLELIMPMFHPAGTCRLGRSDDPDAVVDPHCRVHGIGALRVVDASVMPVIPRANTCIPTMMVAERAAELMRAE